MAHNEPEEKEVPPPKRIWLQYTGDSYDYHEGVTWCVDKINDDDVEYVRVEK